MVPEEIFNIVTVTLERLNKIVEQGFTLISLLD